MKYKFGQRSFWCRGYYVDTVGKNAKRIAEYVRNQLQEDVDAIMEGLNYLGENEYSYRYMRMGENYEDIEEQFYDGEKDEDIYLEYPSMIREFDDEYIKDLISEKTLENEEKNKEEIDI